MAYPDERFYAGTKEEVYVSYRLNSKAIFARFTLAVLKTLKVCYFSLWFSWALFLPWIKGVEIISIILGVSFVSFATWAVFEWKCILNFLDSINNFYLEYGDKDLFTEKKVVTKTHCKKRVLK